MRLLLFVTLMALVGAGSPILDDARVLAPQHLMFVSNFGRSHMIPYLEVLRPLAQRGHKVSVITDRAAAQWLRPNYPLYNVHLVPDTVEEHVKSCRNDDFMHKLLDPHPSRGFALILEKFTVPMYSVMVQYLHGLFTSEKPDMVMCDLMLDSCADVADTLGIKLAVTMSGISPGVADAPYLPNWFSAYLQPSTQHLTLWQCFCDAFIQPVKILSAVHKPIQQVTRLKQQHAIRAPSGPPGVRFAHALKLINSFIGFEAPRPIDPTVQLIGPIRSHANSTVPPVIQDWLDQLAVAKSSNVSSQTNSTNPRVIYVAFGTHVDMPSTVLVHLSNALIAALDGGHADGVIWAVSNIKRDKFPAAIEQDSRVLLLPSAPQKALLAHPYVSLFISHGGAESSHEAMFEGVPMLIISFFGDQPLNGIRLREAGMAETLRQHLVTTDKILPLLAHMVNPATADPYRAAAQRMRSLVRTLDKTNTVAAANMLEFYAQYGWDHLIPAGVHMPWHKATNADLYALLTSAVVGILALTAYIVHAVVRIALQKMRAGKKTPVNKNSRDVLTFKADAVFARYTDVPKRDDAVCCAEKDNLLVSTMSGRHIFELNAKAA